MLGNCCNCKLGIYWKRGICLNCGQESDFQQCLQETQDYFFGHKKSDQHGGSKKEKLTQAPPFPIMTQETKHLAIPKNSENKGAKDEQTEDQHQTTSPNKSGNGWQDGNEWWDGHEGRQAKMMNGGVKDEGWQANNDEWWSGQGSWSSSWEAPQNKQRYEPHSSNRKLDQ